VLTAKAAMSVPATFSFDSPGDAARAAELRRVKALATLVLAGTLALAQRDYRKLSMETAQRTVRFWQLHNKIGK